MHHAENMMSFPKVLKSFKECYISGFFLAAFFSACIFFSASLSSTELFVGFVFQLILQLLNGILLVGKLGS